MASDRDTERAADWLHAVLEDRDDSLVITRTGVGSLLVETPGAAALSVRIEAVDDGE